MRCSKAIPKLPIISSAFLFNQQLIIFLSCQNNSHAVAQFVRMSIPLSDMVAHLSKYICIILRSRLYYPLKSTFLAYELD